MNSIALISLIGTLLGYCLIKKLHQHHRHLYASPAILLPAIIMLIMVLTHVSYAQYMQDTQWIVWLLCPVTVAFAIPIYEYRALVCEHIIAIGMGIVVGMSAGILSAWYLSQWFHFSPEITYSLMSRSISTPFAVELASHIHGSAELTTLFTILTGMVGMLAGDVVLAVLRLHSHIAEGASLGNAAHGFGSSKAMQRHQEQGVIASLTMVLAGIFMVLCGPQLITLLTSISA